MAFNNKCIYVSSTSFEEKPPLLPPNPLNPLTRMRAGRSLIGRPARWGLGRCEPNTAKEFLNVRHVVHGALSQR